MTASPLKSLLIRLRALRGVSSVELANLRKAFQRLETSLPAIASDIGSRYTKVTELLEPLSEASYSLLTESQDLLRLATGQEDCDLITSGTAELLAEPLQYLDGWRSEVMAKLSQLQACGDILSRLNGSQEVLRTLVSPLHYMQVMFRVESARLPEDVRQIFEGLTEQIGRVHTEVRDTFGEQFQVVGTTLITLQRVTDAIEKQAHKVERDLEASKAQIAASLAALRVELNKNTGRDEALTAASKAVAESISNMVMALQTHDIAGQRLVHVREGVDEVRDLASKPRRQGADPLQKAFYLLTVQQKQMSGVHDQLQQSDGMLAESITQLRSRISCRGGECSLFKEFKEVTAAASGSIQVSLEMAADVRGLLEAVIDCSREFYDAIGPMGQLTTVLAGALEGLSIKMRLIALNAQVQAVQIGRGTGLEVLAAQIAEVSSNTSQLAESISNDIESLVATVRLLAASFGEISERGDGQLAHLRSEGARHETLLQALRDRTAGKLQKVGESAELIARYTEEVGTQSEGSQASLKALASAAEELSRDLELINQAIYHLDHNLAAELDRAHYSMESERLAHQQALSSLSGALTGANAASDESLFSAEPESAAMQVELF